MGHNTSRCSLLRDLAQKGLNEGRLKFGNRPKPQIQVEFDPLKDASMMYTDIAGCNMVKAIIDDVENLSVETEVGAETEVAECQMVDITKDAEYVEETALEPQFDEKLKTTYSTAEEELIDFLNRCKLKNYGVMFCPKCSNVFDKEATKGLEGSIPKPKKRGNGLLIIDLSFPSQRVTFLSSITLRPPIMSIRVVREKLWSLMHQTKNGFSRTTRMCNMGRTTW